MTFFPDPSISVPNGEEVIRRLEVEKNRNGRAYGSILLSMTEEGLVPYETDDDEEDDERS
jgi:hypothetical protein